MKPAHVTISITLQALALVTAVPAWAQDPPAAGGGEEGQGAPGQGPGVTVVQVPAPTYPGSLPPAGFDPDAHLGPGSHSLTDINKGDRLDDRSGTGTASVRGTANGSYVVEGQSVPDGHTVRRGDTLWEISGRYYQNPYQWPKLWSFNPQIQNPHWIYPGDRVRLRDGSTGGSTIGNIGMLKSRNAVPPQTIFLRETGWVDDRKDDTWGELVGAPDDKMFLSDGDEVYLQLGEDHDVQLGDELTLFRPIRTVETENAKGELVSIRGTAKIDRYNPKTRMVRARITEALDVIERGVKVGPVGRKFDVVPPVVADADLDANILASLYPNQVYVQNQIVFIDKGAKEGVKPGQRFFAIRRGDRWIQNIKGAGPMAIVRPRVEDDRFAKVDTLKIGVDSDLFPDETYAELRVLSTREHTAAVLVVATKYEIERNARLISRKGL